MGFAITFGWIREVAFPGKDCRMRIYPLDARSTIENYREQLSGTVSADRATCSLNSFEPSEHSVELKKSICLVCNSKAHPETLKGICRSPRIQHLIVEHDASTKFTSSERIQPIAITGLYEKSFGFCNCHQWFSMQQSQMMTYRGLWKCGMNSMSLQL